MQLVVNPVGPQTINPNLQIQIHLAVMANISPKVLQYRFEAKVPMNGDRYDSSDNASTWIWTPQEAGDYVVTATVIELVPGNPARVPCGSATMQYHIAPQKISSVTLSATPASMSVPGNITLHAAVPGGFPGVNKYRFTFSCVQYWGATPQVVATGVVTTTTPAAVWTLNPQPAPDLYRMRVDVETYILNRLVAEGVAQSDANGYAVLFTRGRCAAATPTSTPTTPFGWLNPITSQNTRQPVATAIPNADCAIAGYSINDIVNNPQVRVRKINVACNNCHMDFHWQQKSAFCSYALAFGHAATDPVLQNLLLDWNHRGCPD